MTRLERARSFEAEVNTAVADGDHERAHSIEDSLLWLLVETVLECEPREYQELMDIAQVCRRVGDMDFSRWCA